MHERALVLLDSSARANDPRAASRSRRDRSGGVTVSASNIAWLADASTLQRVADEPLRRAISRSYFCLADALALNGHLDRSFEVATKAAEVYRTLCDDHEQALLRSYQQLAAIADRLDRGTDAIMFVAAHTPTMLLAARTLTMIGCCRHMELVLEQVKLRHDDAAMAAVQEGTRHVIRLCLRQMTMQHRALLDRIISQVCGASAWSRMQQASSHGGWRVGIAAASTCGGGPRGAALCHNAAVHDGSIWLRQLGVAPRHHWCVAARAQQPVPAGTTSCCGPARVPAFLGGGRWVRGVTGLDIMKEFERQFFGTHHNNTNNSIRASTILMSKHTELSCRPGTTSAEQHLRSKHITPPH